MKKLRKFINPFFVLLSVASFAQVKIGSNPTSIGASSLLELESTNKALLITRAANTSAITSPVNGMLIYDISANCVKGYENGAWSTCMGSNPTSGGTAIISGVVDCSASATGKMYVGLEVGGTGVSQIVSVNVLSAGTYSISATSNGVTFSGSGSLSAGLQTIVLNATGIPTAAGTFTFSLNTLPSSCSFTREVVNGSSGGTAVISNYDNCSFASAGQLYVGTESSGTGVTQTIRVNVASAGTYNISFIANGVTFFSTGTLTTGLQNIVLVASGIPTSAGTFAYSPNTSPNTCSFSRTAGNPSSGGTSVISGFSCASSTPSGILTVDVPIGAGNVTQTIVATVTTLGTYNFSIYANGVTFTASGTFTLTGGNNVVLTASGTPLAAGTFGFSIPNTTCFFTRTVLDPTSSGGSAVVGSYTCSTASQGNMAVGLPVSGVTQTITAVVTTPGTYNISAIANGVTFAGTGTFSSTGPVAVVLTASGTPTASGNAVFTLATIAQCSFTRTIEESFVTTTCPVVGTWPASLVIDGGLVNITKITSTDAGTSALAGLSCGVSVSGTVVGTGGGTTLIESTYTFDNPLKGVQIFTGLNETTEGIRVSASLNGVSVPISLVPYGSSCVSDFVVTQSGNTSSIVQTLTAATRTVLVNISSSSFYDRITVTRLSSPANVGFNSHGFLFCNAERLSNPSSGGTSVVTNYSCSTGSTGVLAAGQPILSATQTITAEVSSVGNYNITAINNGVTFYGYGFFTGTGPQNITLTASGTPTTPGNYTFTIDSTPGCNFSRFVGDFSSGGSAVVSNYTNCSTASVGTLNVGQAVSGVSQTITADVTTLGTYYITTSNNGVTFLGSGTFTNTGPQDVILTASGNPIYTGNYTFILGTNPGCSFLRTVPSGVIVGNATCSGKTISVAGCSSVSGATINDVTTTTQGVEYDWSGATGFVAGGNTRALVEIGRQCWYLRNADNLPSNFNPSPTFASNNNNGWSGYYTGGPFTNEGRLYQSKAALNNSTTERTQGVCPSGWHIPSDCEWMYLENSLGMSVAEQQTTGARNTGNVGRALSILTPSGTNNTGFTALFVGTRDATGLFTGRGTNTIFWTSTLSGASFFTRTLSSSVNGVSRQVNGASTSRAVRCLKD